ncbi:glycosyltransferase, putative [Syntrophotalea carbinolica DSM 2380]|uniref:Glycosyltransferase, putative n=1 Tax=Syntrophotalea carbinolica (strain DSM 2380 / NBRC 103641 / GraBd1) TaxID=338963 RepID=Q3A5I5_SYNC1|nr:glycosyltransferase [Syntrophotalea carbinolica]ABA88372.1 glycosyltransferase, putative [Syntrophotalea carbinolica DSM 2380]
MKNLIQVLHITPHLGGGVGKALSGLVEQAAQVKSPVHHTIACLEEPEKRIFVDRAKATGCDVVIAPAKRELATMVSAADIVQLEWWNHPATLRSLCSQPFPPMRLLVWSHVSGLHTPVTPPELYRAAHRFLFTSPCSYEAGPVKNLPEEVRNRLGVVNSCGGFSGFPVKEEPEGCDIKAGYIGSLNFSKLHPRYVDFLVAIREPHFTVKMIGDELNKDILQQQCDRAGRRGLLDFCGFKENVVGELMSINTLIYLLNPEHYGTTENALLETMAMGIVPIVLNNPAERHIVAPMKTGFIIESPQELADAIDWIKNNPAQFKEMGKRAAITTRERFSGKKMESLLTDHYQELLGTDKETVSFIDIFGKEPPDWFLSCQKTPQIFAEDTIGESMLTDLSVHGLIEKTKGTAHHFHKYFPDNKKLMRWSHRLSEIANDDSTPFI